MDWRAEIKKLQVVSYEHHNEFGDEDSDDAYLKVQVDDLLKRMLEHIDSIEMRNSQLVMDNRYNTQRVKDVEQALSMLTNVDGKE